ncbi:PD-(D/E)XK nuclease family protein [Leptolyngbya sp. PCC 6406]|uniref:PDDEXK-like family protein n=1 Tax=Leptolyngbya sp. PCC 6406 TaxID=1173264 RepID=UPI00138B04B0|nr:PD-(D/E)XK nuclease family protein [Leptolyngbya sp. PCC 6406]
MPAPDPQKLLEQLVVNNADLERLESLLNQFNIFEAVGMVRQEIRHSRFLSFLLNPNAPHHLRDIFLKAFLKQLLLGANNATVSPIDIDIADLTDTEVRREWKNIDILLVSPGSQIVCAIENKVDSGEHSNQLQRYRQIVQQEFPNYRQIFVFLTPQGIFPDGEADQEHWCVYSYRKVADLIGEVCDRHRATLQPEVCTLMQHYSTLINRHLMEDSEIAKLCRDIYLKHQAAIDLIYEHRPALDIEAYKLVKKLVNEASPDQIVFDDSWTARKILSFSVPRWDDFPAYTSCQGWTKSQRILLLQFHVEPPILKLILCLGPGDPNIRQSIYLSIKDHNILGFTTQQPSPEVKWLALVERIISEDLRPEMFISDIEDDVRQFWQQFLTNELPRIDEAIVQAFGTAQG